MELQNSKLGKVEDFRILDLSMYLATNLSDNDTIRLKISPILSILFIT